MPYFDARLSIDGFSKPLIWCRNTPTTNIKPLVVFDRDDTLIEDAGQNNSASELKFFPSSLPAITLLVEHGFEISIATNQASIGRGVTTLQQLSDFHDSLDETIYARTGSCISIIAICPHVSNFECNCRKPKTGLLDEISAQLKKKPKVFFGNSSSDIQAAKDFGISGIQVNEENLFHSVYEWIRNQC
jgi:D-glycero-D-manno-heptose 1,7-bisphosphate phosphatase